MNKIFLIFFIFLSLILLQTSYSCPAEENGPRKITKAIIIICQNNDMDSFYEKYWYETVYEIRSIKKNYPKVMWESKIKEAVSEYKKLNPMSFKIIKSYFDEAIDWQIIEVKRHREYWNKADDVFVMVNYKNKPKKILKFIYDQDGPLVNVFILQ